MQFPETWTSQTRPVDPDMSSKRKRRSKTKPKQSTTDTPTPADTTTTTEPPEEFETVPKRVCIDATDDNSAMQRRKVDPKQTKRLDSQPRHSKGVDADTVFNPVNVSITSEEAQVPIVLEIYSLISRLPYAQMLNQVFTDDASNDVVVPVVTRAYEESYMREVIHTHERPCVSGENCECNFIDPLMPFVGVEFVMSDNSMGDDSHQMCVLCSRRLTQELFFNMVYNGHRFRGIIQRYGNLCNQPLEYARDAMLICPQNGLMQNMPLPMVAHQRHRYSVFSQNGIRYLRQHKVMYEDFHHPSSSTLSLQP
jgi:hypothetical protein